MQLHTSQTAGKLFYKTRGSSFTFEALPCRCCGCLKHWGMASRSQNSREMSFHVTWLSEKQLLCWVTAGHPNYLVRGKALQLCVDMSDLLCLLPEAERRIVTLRQDTGVFPFQTFAKEDIKSMLWLICNRTVMDLGLNTFLCARILDFLTSRTPEVKVGITHPNLSFSR